MRLRYLCQLSFFVLQLLISAREAGNQKFEEELIDYATKYWENILYIEHDLIYYGRMSYKDIENLPILERDKFLEFTRDKYKESLENGTALFARLFGV